MIKPQGLDQVQPFTSYEALEAGGHICKIVQATETKSKAGRDMVVILLDTDITDKQPEYFKKKFDSNQNPDKKWPNNAVVRQLVYDADGNPTKGFATFIACIKKCHPGLTDEKIFGNFPIGTNLKGKLIGGVFGEEEYLNNYSESKFAVKFQNFRTVEDIKKGVEVPKKKLLNPSGNNNSNASDLYGDLQVVDDGSMPF